MGILRKIYSFLIDALQSLLIAAAVFLVIYVFIAKPFNVVGLSMYPNFQDKSYVLTSVISLRFQNPKLGDVVVFRPPPPNDPEKSYIKRVIGTPGDTLKLQDGNVYLNNKLLDESAYLKPSVKTYGGTFLKDGQKITIPPDSYFVMGDNRAFSSDSREWGYVSRDKFEGFSFFVYWPIKDAKAINNPYKN